MSLIIKNLKKSFGDKRIFDGFSFYFPSVGVYALVGKSGIGKTTLLRIISGLDTEFTGTIIGGGKENVAVAFQEYRLFPTLTAIDNVIYANHAKATKKTRAEAYDMLTKLGFNDNEMLLFPHQLSGGMKQRVSLARALLRDRDILLLDEPTKELDAELASSVMDLISEESKRRLVILVTHNESDIEHLNAQCLRLTD